MKSNRSDGDMVFHKKRKISKGKKIVIIAGILCIAAGAGGILFWQMQKKNVREISASAVSSVTETTAKTGNISNTIVGTGNLEADTPVAAKIPSGITVSQVYVESGDHVEKGDVLAEVDEVSVLNAIEDVQNQIEEIDVQISETQDTSEENSISAKVDGRVKKIYIEENGDIADCMLEHNAVMLLSIDGKMAVDLDNISQETSKDETVTVTLSNDSQVEGTVESTAGNSCTVVMTDSGVGLGDTVKVTNSDGTELGTGITYIHQQLEVTGTMGTVSEILVSEDQAVECGEDLLTLDSGEETAEYQALLSSREQLASYLTELIAYSKDGRILAEMDGTIQEIYVSGENDSESTDSNTASGNTGISVTNMSYTSGGRTQEYSYMNERGENAFISLSYMDTIEDGQMEVLSDDSKEPEETSDTCLYFEVLNSSVSNAQTLGIETPVKGAVPQTQITVEDGSYTGNITWNPADTMFQPSSTYQANIVLNASQGYCFAADSVTQISGAILSGITLSEDGKTLSFQITFGETEGEINDQENPEEAEKLDDGTDEEQSEEEQPEQEQNNMQENQNVNNQSSVVQNSSDNTQTSRSSNQGSSSSAAMSASSSESVASQNENQEETAQSQTVSSDTSQYATAFTISGDEQMRLSISVDELDINSVEEGQEAQVTFDAIEDEVFEGNVTKVGTTASASGGVAKYTVEITVPKEEQMKAGMNASATIVIEKRENVVTLSIDALQERGKEVFVYTEKDEEGNLTGEQQVSTGLSDGQNVEITEGLSDGDTVYYEKIGGNNSSSDGFSERVNPGEGSNGEMPRGDMSSGEMPGGGQMPDNGDSSGMGRGMGGSMER